VSCHSATEATVLTSDHIPDEELLAVKEKLGITLSTNRFPTAQSYANLISKKVGIIEPGMVGTERSDKGLRRAGIETAKAHMKAAGFVLISEFHYQKLPQDIVDFFSVRNQMGRHSLDRPIVIFDEKYTYTYVEDSESQQCVRPTGFLAQPHHHYTLPDDFVGSGNNIIPLIRTFHQSIQQGSIPGFSPLMGEYEKLHDTSQYKALAGEIIVNLYNAAVEHNAHHHDEKQSYLESVVAKMDTFNEIRETQWQDFFNATRAQLDQNGDEFYYLFRSGGAHAERLFKFLAENIQKPS